MQRLKFVKIAARLTISSDQLEMEIVATSYVKFTSMQDVLLSSRHRGRIYGIGLLLRGIGRVPPLLLAVLIFYPLCNWFNAKNAVECEATAKLFSLPNNWGRLKIKPLSTIEVFQMLVTGNCKTSGLIVDQI